jgi:hypothetical protein
MHEMSPVVHNSVAFWDRSGENRHMGIWGKLQNAERNLRKRIRLACGEATRTPPDIRREILEQVKSRITAETGFPYTKTIVWFQPPTEALRDVFEAAFLQEDSLKTKIVEMLKDANAQHPEPFEVIVDFKRDLTPGSEAPAPRPLFQIEFIKHDPSIGKKVPETSFVISKGSAEQPSYELKKERILIGRLQEVLDREGRMIRMNDVIFLDNGEDINSTVDRAHARIWFDFEEDGFFIMDEVSHFGTIIMRDSRSIDVPAGNPRGIRLRSGDAIYCGQACLRFEIKK